jgi:hypothetical protein
MASTSAWRGSIPVDVVIDLLRAGSVEQSGDGADPARLLAGLHLPNDAVDRVDQDLRRLRTESPRWRRRG